MTTRKLVANVDSNIIHNSENNQNIYQQIKLNKMCYIYPMECYSANKEK